MKIYVVKQYQPTEGYNGDIIYAYSKEETAIEAARILNKTYGDNCIFSMEGDYEETLNEDNCHFYIVEPVVVKEQPLPDDSKYYDYFVIKCGWFYVGEEGITQDKDKVQKFNTWDEARSMLKVFQSLDIYKDEGPLYIKGFHIMN